MRNVSQLKKYKLAKRINSSLSMIVVAMPFWGFWMKVMAITHSAMTMEAMEFSTKFPTILLRRESTTFAMVYKIPKHKEIQAVARAKFSFPFRDPIGI